jgi:hypothetical protein
MSVNHLTARSSPSQSWLDLMAITARGILLLKYAIDRSDDLLAIVIGGYRLCG